MCINQFHLPKNGREGLKLVYQRWLWWKWNTIFPSGTACWEKRDHLFRSSLGPGSPVWKKWLKTGRSKTALKEPSCFPSIARLPPGSLRSRLPQRWSRWSQAISDVASLPEIFPLERPKKSCSVYFLTGFSGNFLQMVNNLYSFAHWYFQLSQGTTLQ